LTDAVSTKNEWTKIKKWVPLEISTKKIKLSTPGYVGDFVVDHFLILKGATYQRCRKTIEIDFSSKIIKN